MVENSRRHRLVLTRQSNKLQLHLLRNRLDFRYSGFGISEYTLFESQRNGAVNDVDHHHHHHPNHDTYSLIHFFFYRLAVTNFYRQITKLTIKHSITTHKQKRKTKAMQ
jgi:hypothetical protein